jgi:gliding motility-associated-like protein
MKKLLLSFLLVFWSVFAISQEICGNGIDDDGDYLIDLLDPDCISSSYPIIKNASFEKIWNCPTSYSQLHYAEGWLQPNIPEFGSTDLYHNCGGCRYATGLVSNVPMPVPDGEAFAGFFDIRNWYNKGAYKEHLTTCLDEDLKQDTFYVTEFYLGFITPMVQAPPGDSYYSFSPVNISLFGHPSCTALPYGQLNDTAYKSCPMDTHPQWVELARISVSGTSGQWVRARAEFKSPIDIRSLVIGPSCQGSPYGGDQDWGAYFIDQILVYKKELYDLPVISRSGDVCLDTLTLTATMAPGVPAFSSQWYKDGVALPGETGTGLRVNRGRYGEGDYSVRVTIDDKTWLSAVSTVNIKDLPFTLEDTIGTCGNTTIVLRPQIQSDASNCMVSYLWQNGSTNTSFTATEPGTYWFETNKEGCKRRDSVIVISYPTPVVVLGDDSTLCPGNILLLSADNPGLQYQWQDFSSQQTYQVTAPGRYFVKVSNAYCTASDTIDVAYDRLPEIIFSGDTILCENEQQNLAPQVHGDEFLWNTGSTAREITVTIPGIYTLQATNNCGATAKSIKIIPDNCLFFMPNSFTPNNDNLNDAFGLTNYSFITKFEFRIFNRYGQVVYESTDPATRWDGSYKGNPGTPGVYVWTIKYTDWSNREYLKNGSVNLIR